MKCPRAIAWHWETGHKPQFSYGDCFKEECAWWDKSQSWCVVRALAMELVNIFGTLDEIKDKMPHAGQFPK